MSSPSPRRRPPAFAYEGLDRVIHERARLGVLTSLAAHPKGLSFGDLKLLCGLTDGNLSRHLRVLERERLIAIVKDLRQRRPQTICRVTTIGRRRYIEYLAVLEKVLLDATAAVRTEAGSSRARSPLAST
ncbi:MAG TPA: transcriptional regulator [Steroidobacteraceae bacterium]|nr:transcriptional regulator [Steroidobacteraceae bacterium]